MEFCTSLRSLNCEFNCSPGLQAVKGSDKKRIKFNNPRKIQASINLDSELEKSYPQAARWDYLIVYNSQFCFIEIHHISGKKGLDEVIRKKIFVKKWLNSSDFCALAINSFSFQKRFFLIPTGSVSKNPRAKNYLSPHGISLVDSKILC